MKKIIFTLFILAAFTNLKAQKALPEIKVGTIMSCSAFVQGQEFPLVLTIKDTTSPIIGWSVEGYGDGTFEMSAKALESATKMPNTSGPPALGATVLSDAETFGLISKAAYQSLTTTKTFIYDGLKFKIKTPETAAMKINGKEVDATHVISENGAMELWILNNPTFPIVLQTAGAGTDIVVHEIK